MTIELSIVGATITGNRGAEAMAETVIAKVRERFPEARINLFTYYPRDDRKTLANDTVHVFSATPLSLCAIIFPFAVIGWLLQSIGIRRRPRFFPTSVASLWRSDILIDLAGVSFVDSREKYLPFNILTIWPAMLLGTPVVKFSQAVGGFSGALNRAMAQLFLTRCDKVFVRGELSESHIKNLRWKARSPGRADDVAFLFEPEYRLSKPAPESERALFEKVRLLKSGSRCLIGVCPSAVIMQKVSWNYPGLLAKMIEERVRSGAGIVLFPNATRTGVQLRNNDLPVIAEVMSNLSPAALANTVAVDYNADAATIKTLISLFDVAVVSRFHSMVAALSQCVPVLVIGWSHKYLEVMSLFGQEKRVFDYAAADDFELRQQLDDLLHNRESISKEIQFHLQDVRESATTQFDYLFEKLARK